MAISRKRFKAKPKLYWVEWQSREGGPWNRHDGACDLPPAKDIAEDLARYRIDGDLVAIRTRLYGGLQVHGFYLVVDGSLIAPRSASDLFYRADTRLEFEAGWAKASCSDIVELAAKWDLPRNTLVGAVLECLETVAVARGRMNHTIMTGLNLVYSVLRGDLGIDEIQRFRAASNTMPPPIAEEVALYQIMSSLITPPVYSDAYCSISNAMIPISSGFEYLASDPAPMETQCRDILNARISLGALLLAGYKVRFSREYPSMRERRWRKTSAA